RTSSVPRRGALPSLWKNTSPKTSTSSVISRHLFWSFSKYLVNQSINFQPLEQEKRKIWALPPPGSCKSAHYSTSGIIDQQYLWEVEAEGESRQQGNEK